MNEYNGIRGLNRVAELFLRSNAMVVEEQRLRFRFDSCLFLRREYPPAPNLNSLFQRLKRGQFRALHLPLALSPAKTHFGHFPFQQTQRITRIHSIRTVRIRRTNSTYRLAFATRSISSFFLMA